MKSTIAKLIAAIIAMLLGLLLLETTHHVIPLLTGAVGIIVGFSYISYTIAEMLWEYKVFEFKHYYFTVDPFKSCETLIGKELDYNERTQLKYYDEYFTKHAFRDSPVIVDDITACDIGIQRVTGWVKARDKDEAEKILKYTEDWDELLA